LAVKKVVLTVDKIFWDSGLHPRKRRTNPFRLGHRQENLKPRAKALGLTRGGGNWPIFAQSNPARY
jgi:hypothetical protein